MATVISQSSFTVAWTPVTSDCGSTVSYEIVADSADCGTCAVNTGTPSATCTGWTPRGQNCSVRVRATQDLCGGFLGDSLPLILFLNGIIIIWLLFLCTKVSYSKSAIIFLLALLLYPQAIG